MRIFKYLFGLWTAIAVYAIFSFVAGPRGISAYNYLLSERDKQWENMKELSSLNEELEKTRNNLLYDHDTLLVQARQMGYGQEDERFVRIVGLNNIRTVPAVSGNIYAASSPEFISDRAIKITALIIGCLIFAFLLMIDIIDLRVKKS